MPEVRVTGAGSEMQGVGRLPDGRAVFIPGALPGETVSVRITREDKRYCEGALTDIIIPSRERRASDCAHYEECGGCRIRHCTYEYSLVLKRARVSDALERVARLKAPVVRETLGCAVRERMRNKAEYQISGGVIGMRVRSGRRVVPIDDCLLQTEGSAACLRFAAPRLESGHEGYLVTRVNRRGEIMVILSLNSRAPAWLTEMLTLPGVVSVWHCRLRPRAAHALDGVCTRIAGAISLKETVCGLDFEISPQTFMQVNTPQSENLYGIAVDTVKGARSVLDLYCGAGAMTLMAARACGMATGVEIVAPAIADARRNAARNGLGARTRFICADAARELPRLAAVGERFDRAILDPPRGGADARVLDALCGIKPEKITYVSCDPATLARDVKRLCEGGYTLEWAQPVDMFPWTEHVETVCLLTRV